MSMTDLTIVRKSLAAHFVSTLITALSVAIAVALLVVLFSLREHAQNSFKRGTGNMHVLISADASPLTSVLNNVFYANPPQKKLLMSDLDRLGLTPAAAAPGAEPTTRPRDPRLEWAIPVQSGDSFRSFKTMATTADFFAKFQPAEGVPWTLRDGAFFDGTWQAVLGDTVARQTGLKVGDEIYITHGWSNRSHAPVPGDTPATKTDDHDHDHADHNHDHDAPGDGPHIHNDHPIVIVGILEPTGSPHDRAVFIPLEASWIMHADEARAAAEPTPRPAREDNLTPDEKAVNAVYVRCRTNTIIGSFFDEMRRTQGITPALPNNQIVALFQIVGSIDQIILAIGVAVLVSSIVSVMLAVYSSMGQRRRQIAVLRVLGATRGRIVSLVLTESALIATIGALAGSALAIVGMRIASSVLLDRTGIYVDPWIDPLWLLVVGVATVLLGAVAGIVPALSAYRTSVVRSLRPLG